LEVQQEDRLQAVTQILAALETDGAGRTVEILIIITAILVSKIKR